MQQTTCVDVSTWTVFNIPEPKYRQEHVLSHLYHSPATEGQNISNIMLGEFPTTAFLYIQPQTLNVWHIYPRLVNLTVIGKYTIQHWMSGNIHETTKNLWTFPLASAINLFLSIWPDNRHVLQVHFAHTFGQRKAAATIRCPWLEGEAPTVLMFYKENVGQIQVFISPVSSLFDKNSFLVLLWSSGAGRIKWKASSL